jgi:hypothetical protein
MAPVGLVERMYLSGQIAPLEPFNPDTTDWSTWMTRFSNYCELTEVTDAAKRRQLLSILLGGPTFKLLTELIRPDTYDQKTPAELLAVLTAHNTPRKLVIAECYRFYKRSQKEGETVAQYIAELRRLAVDCQFGEFLSRSLRDRLVMGLRNEAV